MASGQRSGSDISLQIIREAPAHLLSLATVLELLFPARGATSKPAAPTEILTTITAQIRNDLFHPIQFLTIISGCVNDSWVAPGWNKFRPIYEIHNTLQRD
jgi:hypothetical protein